MPLVAVPETEKPTVTVFADMWGIVAVSVIEPELFSAIELALAASVTVGMLSLSVIVRVTCCVPLSVALPTTELISMTTVSSPSWTVSSVGVNVVVPVVEPAETVILESAV